jgi:hypothetical protein
MRKLKLFIAILLLQSCGEAKYPLELGSNYYIDYNSSWGYALIMVDNTEKIGMEIVAWNYDSTFIIVKQKPFFCIYDSISNKYPKMSATKKDYLYEKIKQYNYWIIDKRIKAEWDSIEIRYTGIIYGPYGKEEYLEKRKELGVSDSLKLRETKKSSFNDPFSALFYEIFYSPPARERIVE